MIFAVFAFPLIWYAYFVEPVWLKVRAVPIEVSATHGKTLRIAHISDLHWGAFVSHEYLERAFKTVAAQKPDMILITGDFVNKRIENRAGYEEALRTLSRAAPTYAVPGNHDGGEWVTPGGGYETTDSIRILLTSSGIHFIENDYTCPTIAGLRVCIAGLGDWTGGFTHPELFIDAYDSARADFKILMLHNPDARWTVLRSKWQLMLAGHTHGGQVTIPFIGSPWVRVSDRRELKGLFRFSDRPLHINPGVGASQRRLRINCRPEVSMLEVKL